MDQIEELKQLAPAGTFVEKVTVTSHDRKDDREVSNEHTYHIRQFSYRQFFQVLGHAQSIYAAVQTLKLDLDGLIKKFESAPLELVQPILNICQLVGNDVAMMTVLSIDKPLAYLDTLDPDDGIRLTIAMLKANVSFFVKRILPMLETMKATEPEASESESSVSATQ
jgi:hypothetical protein